MSWGANGAGLTRWRGATVWLTGLPAAGKTTTADAVAERICEAGFTPYRLDGDALRGGLNADLGFDAASRQENVRRTAHVAVMLADAGLIVVASLISPYAEGRLRARELHAAAGLPFLEVFLDTPLSECERRDPRHLYDRAHKGEIVGMTGVDDPYERPADAELVIHPGPQSVAEAADAVVEAILARGLQTALRPATPATPATPGNTPEQEQLSRTAPPAP
jgi:bifunctional enzyme CysN/CysC